MKICYDHRQKARNGRLRDFASKMSPFLNRFLADVRLTHFHRSGTWLPPTDISQTFLNFSETNFCFGFCVLYGRGGAGVRGTNVLAPTAPLYYPTDTERVRLFKIYKLQFAVFHSKTHALKGVSSLAGRPSAEPPTRQ
jgi:hypothetical protein